MSSTPTPPTITTTSTGDITFQLFQNLAPNTVSEIEQFTTDGFYSAAGDPKNGNKNGIYIPRIAPDFPGLTDYIIQGGATMSTNTGGSSGEPGTPFQNENVQQLAFTGTDQLAMANEGVSDSNDTQWFITTGSPNAALGYGYTIFGQLVPDRHERNSGADPAGQTHHAQSQRLQYQCSNSNSCTHFHGIAVLGESQRGAAHRHHAGQGGGHRDVHRDRPRWHLLRQPDVHRHRRRLRRPDRPGHRFQAPGQPGHRVGGRRQLDDGHPSRPGWLS